MKQLPWRDVPLLGKTRATAPCWTPLPCGRYGPPGACRGAIGAGRAGRRLYRHAPCRVGSAGRVRGRVSIGDRRAAASGPRCRGRCHLRQRPRQAARSHRTGRASWNPGRPGPRGSDLCVRPLFGPHVGGVEDDAGQIEKVLGGECVEYCLVQSAPRPGPGPDREPAVGGGLRYPEARREMSPGASAGQHVHDRGEQCLNRRVLRAATLRTHPRQQRPRDLPQAILNDPSPPRTSHAPATTASPRRTRSKTPQ